MKFGEWNAKIIENFGIMGYDLYLWRDTSSGREILTHKGERILAKENESVSDNYFVRFRDKEQIHALAEAFSSFGVKTSNDHKNEGLLEATKYHLEDMRSIAFKKVKR